MKLIKNYKYILNFILFIFILTFIQTILNLIFYFNTNINKIIAFTAIIVYSFISGVKKGKTTDSKGYKVGFKTGITNVLIMYILSCFTISFSLPLTKIIYYLIILITTILGSIVGINKKTLNN